MFVLLTALQIAFLMNGNIDAKQADPCLGLREYAEVEYPGLKYYDTGEIVALKIFYVYPQPDPNLNNGSCYALEDCNGVPLISRTFSSINIPTARVFLGYNLGSYAGTSIVWDPTLFNQFDERIQKSVHQLFTGYHDDFDNPDNFLVPATPLYNCHAYALKIYHLWITDTEIFSYRGCAFQVDRIQDADFLKFGSVLRPNHSAVPILTSGVCGTSTYKYISKFGIGGVYQTSLEAIAECYNSGQPYYEGLYRYYSFEPPTIK